MLGWELCDTLDYEIFNNLRNFTLFLASIIKKHRFFSFRNIIVLNNDFKQPSLNFFQIFYFLPATHWSILRVNQR